MASQRDCRRPERVIRSCTDLDQLPAAHAYARLWVRRHGLAERGETARALVGVLHARTFTIAVEMTEGLDSLRPVTGWSGGFAGPGVTRKLGLLVRGPWKKGLEPGVGPEPPKPCC